MPNSLPRKQPHSEGASDVSQWLFDLGVKPGGFYLETKARVTHAMKSRAWPEKHRVWACLALHTMGFNQELAVRMERGALVPLRQVDIAKETGIFVNNVHRCVLDLESEGWLLRKPLDEARGPLKGEVSILCYALPRPPKKTGADAREADDKPSYDGLAPELAYWLRHLKLSIPDAEKLEEARGLAVELTARVETLRTICKPQPAQMSLPGVPVNPVMAKLTELRSPRAVDEGLARTCEKSDLGLRAAANGVGARVVSNRKKDTERGKTVPAAAVLSQNWGQAAAAVQKYFPRTEDDFVSRLAESCRAALIESGTDPVLLTDQVLADAVKMAHKPGQHSAGLFLKTVPSVLKNWAKPQPGRAKNIWDGV